MINQNHLDNGNIICGDDRNIDLLVRLSVLTKGPLLERRKEIRKSFVLAALSLFPIETNFQVADLSIKVKKITKCEIDNENIIVTLNELKNEKVIQHISGLEYKLIKEIEIASFQQKSQPVWEEFSIFLTNQYKDYDSFIDKDARIVLDNILLNILKRFIISSESLDRQIESLPIEDFISLIMEEVNAANLSKNLTKVYEPPAKST